MVRSGWWRDATPELEKKHRLIFKKSLSALSSALNGFCFIFKPPDSRLLPVYKSERAAFIECSLHVPI